jgi:hypothetical protein
MKAKMVFLPENKYYVTWCFIRLVFSIIESSVIPFKSVAGFAEKASDPSNIVLILSHVVFGVDILLKFFRGYREDNGREFQYVRELGKTALHYIRSELWWDLMLTIPFGIILSQFNPNLSFFNFIKILRIKDLFDLFRPLTIKPIIREYYQNKLLLVLNDHSKRDDIT